MISIEKWAGLVTNASPYAIPPGAAVTQVNLQCLSPGQLAVRPGMTAYTFSSTVAATRPVVSAFRYQRQSGDVVVYQDALGVVFTAEPVQGAGPPPIAGVPGVPSSLSAVAGLGAATLTWTPPASGSVTGYSIQFSSDAGQTWSFGATSEATSVVIQPLSNGTAYVFRVAATNLYGIGDYTAASAPVTPLGPPGPPTSILATSGNAQVALSWTAPASNGGSAVTDYIIGYSANNGQTWATAADGVSNATSYTVAGLTNGVSYVFRVAARNLIGDSPYAEYLTPIAPLGVPDAPTGLQAVYGNSQVSLSWSIPASNNAGGILDYVIQLSTNDGATWATLSDPVSANNAYTVTQLTNGSSYRFRVAASNVTGQGPFSTASAAVMPRTLPGAPTAFSAVAGNQQVALLWTAPSNNGGLPITDYRIQVSASGGAYTTISRAASTSTSYTVAQLTNATQYLFRVAAVTDEGVGPYVTLAEAATPLGVPSAPTQVVAQSGNQAASVFWTAPADNGGSSIFDYLVEYSSNNGTSWTQFSEPQSITTLATVTGLTNGLQYIFRVRAVNAAGNGNYSAPSAAVTPFGLPGAPQSPSATGGNTQLFTRWLAPASNNGSPITGYVVQVRRNTEANWTTIGNVGDVLSYTVSSRVNGYTYYFRVAAINAAGTGTYSAESNAVTVGQVPLAPTAVVVTAGGNRQATITWTASSDRYGSDLTDYLIQYGTTSPTATSGWVTFPDGASTATTATVTGLTVGTTYYFRVSEVSTVGPSPYSTGSAAHIAGPYAPTAPLNVTATPALASASVTWSVPSNVGFENPTSYTVRYSTDGGTSWTTAGTSATTSMTVAGLTNTPTIFQVSATNSGGTGPFSASSSAITPLSNAPDAPTNVAVAYAENGEVKLTWTAANSNGAPITGYVVEYSSNSGASYSTLSEYVPSVLSGEAQQEAPTTPAVWRSATAAASTTTRTAFNLLNGVAYRFRVKAANSNGDGPVSAYVSATPALASSSPSAPNSQPSPWAAATFLGTGGATAPATLLGGIYSELERRVTSTDSYSTYPTPYERSTSYYDPSYQPLLSAEQSRFGSTALGMHTGRAALVPHASQVSSGGAYGLPTTMFNLTGVAAIDFWIYIPETYAGESQSSGNAVSVLTFVDSGSGTAVVVSSLVVNTYGASPVVVRFYSTGTNTGSTSTARIVRNKWTHIMLSNSAFAVDGRIAGTISFPSDRYNGASSGGVKLGFYIGSRVHRQFGSAEYSSYPFPVSIAGTNSFGIPDENSPGNWRLNWQGDTNTFPQFTYAASASGRQIYMNGLRVTYAAPSRGQWWLNDFPPPGLAHYTQ